MKLTDKQIQHIESLMKGAIFKDTKIAGHILQLIADRQAWKEEEEENKKGLLEALERVHDLESKYNEVQHQFNQAVEVIERVHKYAKENSPDSRYLEQVQVELDHFLSQEGGSHEVQV